MWDISKHFKNSKYFILKSSHFSFFLPMVGLEHCHSHRQWISFWINIQLYFNLPKLQVWVNLCITPANPLSPVYLFIFCHILFYSDCLRGLENLRVSDRVSVWYLVEEKTLWPFLLHFITTLSSFFSAGAHNNEFIHHLKGLCLCVYMFGSICEG